MTAATIADLRRELEKARLTLIASQAHLAAHAEVNAALHCADTVLHSPLHAKVTASIQQIGHALARTEQAQHDADQPVALDRSLEQLGRILLDLDRCPHGRHEGDDCGSCGVKSLGNPHLAVGTVAGYTVYAEPITVPVRRARHDPAAWRPERGGRRA